MNSYELHRIFFDWCFENPEKVNPAHVAIYTFAIEHCNRLGWKEKFGFPTQMAMDAIGIKKHQTYIKYFNDLVTWDFFKLIQKSANQYSANIISLSVGKTKKGKALGKATINHAAKQIETIGQSTGQSNGSIDKLGTIEPDNQELITFTFDDFWKIYPVKVGKEKCKTKFQSLKPEEVVEIKNTIESFKAYKPFPSYTHPNPETYLNQKRWQDEITPTVVIKKAYSLPPIVTAPNDK